MSRTDGGDQGNDLSAFTASNKVARSSLAQISVETEFLKCLTNVTVGLRYALGVAAFRFLNREIESDREHQPRGSASALASG